MAERLRAERGETTGLVTAVGWYMTKHAVGDLRRRAAANAASPRWTCRTQVDAGPRREVAAGHARRGDGRGRDRASTTSGTATTGARHRAARRTGAARSPRRPTPTTLAALARRPPGSGRALASTATAASRCCDAAEPRKCILRRARRVSMRVMRRLLVALLIAAALPLSLAAPAGAQNPAPPGASTELGERRRPDERDAQPQRRPQRRGDDLPLRVRHVRLLRPDDARHARPATATSSVNVNASRSRGLTSDTTYHYRIVATNAAGITRGTDQTLQDAVAGPRARASAARPRATSRQNSATLRASLDPRSLATTYYFE